MKPSKEQELAIRTVDKNILVCASAGAGKTTVLIERLMKRIEEDRVSVNEILAMTFTEAAAGEMKRRLSKKLNEKYEKTKDPFLYTQITLLANANISTIHSFCLSVIRNYSYVLNLDPKRASNILDEATASLYKKDALDRVLNRAYATHPDAFDELLEHFSSRPEADQGVRDAIAGLATILGSKPDPEEWLKSSVSSYSVEHSLSTLSEPLRSYFFMHWQLAIEEFEERFSELKGAALNDPLTDDAFMLCLQILSTQIKVAKSAIEAHDYSKIRKAFFTMAENLPATKNKALDEVKEARKSVAKFIQDTLPKLFDEALWIDDLNTMRRRLFRLGELTRDFRHEYASIKEDQNCIDFDDMEHFALAILRDEKFKIREVYKEQFKEILVDEFQDSNDVQDLLVELISRGNNVFRVGDIKQSIYRFRNAKPQIMQGLIQRNHANDLLIYLKQNFRSDQTIVEFNNLVFDHAMNVEGMRSAYLAEDAVSIGSDRQNGGFPVEIHWVVDEEEADEISDEPGDDENNDDQDPAPSLEVDEKPGVALKKARHIADDILQKIQGTPYTKWSDYVILVRSHQLKTYLKRAFDEVGIPYFIDVQSGFYQADSVQDCLQFLHLCLHPENDPLLVGTLLSPFFGFTQDDIATLYRSKGKAGLRETLRTLHPEVDARIRELSEYATTFPMRRLLPLLFDFNHYYTDICTHSQRTNLDLFLQKALSFEENHGSLPKFLDLIEEIKDEKSSEAIPISLEDNVVRVMTIHQSKGLQFPVVYFWSSLRQDVLDLKNEIISDSELGIGIRSILLPQRYVRNNPIRIAIETKAVQEEMEEQMRVLYVALTRPQHLLVIVDAKSNKAYASALTRSAVFRRIGYSGWLATILSNKTSDLYNETEVFGNVSERFAPSVPQKTSEFTPIPRIEETFDFQTPSSQEQVFFPDFTLHYRDVLDGKERGTRLHRLIERLPMTTWDSELIHSIDPACTQDEIEALIAFHDTDYYQNAKSAIVEREFPFAILERNRLINGVVDMLAIYPDRVELVDFKTDRFGTATQLIERYQGQLRAYFEALRIVYPDKEVKTFLYSFNLKEILEVHHENHP